MKKSIKVLFFLYKSKLNRNREAPIYCRITLNKKRKHFSTGFFVSVAQWDSKQHKVKSSNPKFSEINNYLNAIERKVLELSLKYQVNNIAYTLDGFMNELLGKKDKNIETFLAVFRKHNDEMQKLIGKSFSPATHQKFTGIYKQVQAFIKKQYKQEDVLLFNLKLKFLLEFESFLFTDYNLKQVSINKTTQRIKKVVKYAIGHDLMEKDPFILHKSKKVVLDVIYLTPEELVLLEEYQIESNALIQTRDCFVFCCYTGLAYREMAALESKNIVKGFDGKDWIKITRQKTNKPLMIPILSKASEILKKYAETGTGEQLLPVISNQRFNKNLKTIAEEIGIKKKLSHHVARKTFASTVLLYNDVPIEVVSELLGHADIKTTQRHYGKVANKKLSQHMERVAEKLK